MSRDVSSLEAARAAYAPRLPEALAGGIAGLGLAEGAPTSAVADADAIRQHFPGLFGQHSLDLVGGDGPARREPLRVGVVLSGGQAPGGHNVIGGLFDALSGLHGEARLFGFLGGPRGIFTENYRELSASDVDAYRNTGGFDMIGSGRDKISTDEQLAACRAVAKRMELDGLVIIGGDDSNTNAAVLAESFAAHGIGTAVVGVPKTIDGDLRGGPVEASFGFDTATKVYAELIGNICRDARSAGKYWHFVKLMGRAASHVTLECALATRPNVALVGEEVQAKGQTLREVVEHVAGVVRDRAQSGKNYGVCLVPEGLIEFIPEMRVLIDQLNHLLAEKSATFETLGSMEQKLAFVRERIDAASAEVFAYLPDRIQEQLLLDRDSHGNVQVSKIDTEQLLSAGVERLLNVWKRDGAFSGSFKVQPHFFGYEGRCAAPSNFDADYTYGLGFVAASLIAFERSGYLASLGGLAASHENWRPGGVPLTSLMQIEMRKGKPTPVIAKALVDLEGAPFTEFAENRESWAVEDRYRYPGPIQYFGPDEIADATTWTLRLESGMHA